MVAGTVFPTNGRVQISTGSGGDRVVFYFCELYLQLSARAPGAFRKLDMPDRGKLAVAVRSAIYVGKIVTFAGEAGFEPANSGSKVRRLAAWPLPKIFDRPDHSTTAHDNTSSL